MGKQIFFLAVLIVMVSLSGCSKEGAFNEVTSDSNLSSSYEATKETETVSSEEESKPDITLELQEYNTEEKNTDGTVLIEVKGNFPKVLINGKVSEEIDKFYEEKQNKLQEEINEMLAYAKEDYSYKKAENIQWAPYGIGKSYELKYTHPKAISLIEIDYQYSGGAHPNMYYTAQNFDMQTYKHLTLSDIMTDEKKGIEFINSYILDLIKTPQYSEYSFWEPEENVKNILTNDTWYFSEEGLVIICNTYIIESYAAGEIYFIVPYDKLIYLKDEYKLNNIQK